MARATSRSTHGQGQGQTNPVPACRQCTHCRRVRSTVLPGVRSDRTLPGAGMPVSVSRKQQLRPRRTTRHPARTVPSAKRWRLVSRARRVEPHSATGRRTVAPLVPAPGPFDCQSTAAAATSLHHRLPVHCSSCCFTAPPSPSSSSATRRALPRHSARIAARRCRCRRTSAPNNAPNWRARAHH